jgi:SAM-dependent methyltransferase
MTSAAIQPHNTRAATTWNAGGADYERISESIADSIDHCVAGLAPRHGERVLDVATGTGLAARRVAAQGAQVVGIDFGADLIEAARKLAEMQGLQIDFRVGDAEKLPFADATFDVVLRRRNVRRHAAIYGHAAGARTAVSVRVGPRRSRETAPRHLVRSHDRERHQYLSDIQRRGGVGALFDRLWAHEDARGHARF